MKTITTLFISIITLVASANATEANLEITSTSIINTLAAGTTENAVILNWSSRKENSNTRYEIERSFYSNNFNTIATLQVPFSGNSNVKNYRISDNAAELAGRTIAYYRVKQTDANGTVTYSNTMVVSLQNTDTNSAVATVKTTSISFTAAQNGNAVINVKNTSGKTAATTNATIVKGNNTVELNNLAGLAKGMYIAEVSVNGVTVDSQKIIAE
ncbi:MAG: hypothetical protein QM791_01860 [Ferruginibacter sp.]